MSETDPISAPGRLTLDLVPHALSGAQAARLAQAIDRGQLAEVRLLAASEAAELASSLVALHAEHIAAGEDAYSQFLVGRGGALFNWGTEAGEGAVRVELGEDPLLARVAASALALAEALGGEGELLLSLVPALRKTRTFPRFFHRDSHASISELDHEGSDLAAPSCYRSVWDLGLEHSSDVLDVAFARREELLDESGGVAERWRRLFQQNQLDFRHLSDQEIDRIQPQMREELLPEPSTDERPRLLEGRAFVWHDDRFFHSTYLRAGRSLGELARRPRSIFVIREFVRGAHREIPWSEAVGDLLPDVLGG